MGDRRAWKQEAADGGTSNNNKNNRRARAPKGHFVVYVGKELKRFVVPLSLLKSFKFQQLLDKAAEEYGYVSKQGRIVLPCDESAFLTLTHSL
ncbi:hypothetical protein FEM48_Zijuj04G0201700 [Ziziphus jujuba var. spinosa]|uniref:Uncharacterized protein n=1 Tax=Ziziphus jujuba var. spinosa TaxID=714518 RepID=A0A978VLY4_ZIZJJ|nr:hypothetical protein FEM48_Zijuj04G0201700 [Ziziphus jujuba var. spinosa]